MGKIKIGIVFICFVLLSLPARVQTVIDTSCVVSTFYNYVGVREATGHNDGDDVERFLNSAGVAKGAPWCAAFVAYCQRHCQKPVPKSPAWSPSWFPTSRVINTRGDGMVPQPGDVFGIWFQNRKRIAHVGYVAAWPDGNMAVTVEGNTNEAGSREGDGVYKKRRPKRTLYKIARWQ